LNRDKSLPGLLSLSTDVKSEVSKNLLLKCAPLSSGARFFTGTKQRSTGSRVSGTWRKQRLDVTSTEAKLSRFSQPSSQAGLAVKSEQPRAYACFHFALGVVLVRGIRRKGDAKLSTWNGVVPDTILRANQSIKMPAAVLAGCKQARCILPRFHTANYGALLLSCR
jgi:hypothetical protein